jgi:MFS family permease
MRQFIAYLRQFVHFQRNARLYLLQSALFGIGLGIFLLLYPLYLSALGYQIDLIGLILFFTPLGTGVALIPAGLCVDRFSGKAILIWSSVVVGIAVLGQILFRDPVLLCISAFGVGIGVSFQYVLNAPFLMQNGTPDERRHLFSLNIVLILAATVLGQLLGGALPVWLREHPSFMFSRLSWLLASQSLARSYQIALLFGVLIALTSFIPLFLMTANRPTRARLEDQPLPRVLSSRRKPLLSLRKNFQKDTITPRDATDLGITLSFWSRLRRYLFNPLTIMTGAYVLGGFGNGLLFPYIGLFFVEHLGANSALFGIISGSSSAILALAVLLAPWLAIRIGNLKTIVFTSLLALPVLLCISISPFLLLAIILYPLFQALWNMANGIVQLFGMEVIPQKLQGRANSSYQVASQIALAAGTPIGGLLIKHLDYTPVFWITATLFLLTQVIMWWRFAGKDFVTPEPSLVQYPITDRRNEENLTPLPASPDGDYPNRTIPNRSSGFALGTTEGGQEEDEKVMTSSEDTEQEQDDEKVNSTEHSQAI